MNWLVYAPSFGETAEDAEEISASSATAAVREWCKGRFYRNPGFAKDIEGTTVMVQEKELHLLGGTELTAWKCQVSVRIPDPEFEVKEVVTTVVAPGKEKS